MNKRQKKKKEKLAVQNAQKNTASEVKEPKKSSTDAVVIDFADYETRAAFHAAFHKEKAFPDYEGNNLDAIFDMLTEIGSPLSVTVKNLHSWQAAADSYKGNIEKLLVRADKENPALTISIEG